MTKIELRYKLHGIFNEWMPVSLPFLSTERLFKRYYTENINAEDVKRWYQILVGIGEVEMKEDIKKTLKLL